MDYHPRSEPAHSHYVSYHATLLLPHFADPKQILRQYRTLMLKYHPDKQVAVRNSKQGTHQPTNIPKSATRRLREIVRAYEILRTDETRKSYNRALHRFVQKCFHITLRLSISQLMRSERHPLTVSIDSQHLEFVICWRACNWIMGKSTYLISDKLNTPILRNTQSYYRVLVHCIVQDSIPTRIIDGEIFHLITKSLHAYKGLLPKEVTVFKAHHATTFSNDAFQSNPDAQHKPETFTLSCTSPIFKILNLYDPDETRLDKMVHVLYFRERFWVTT